jgi:hypothetical protein
MRGLCELRVAAMVMRVWCASVKSRCCVILLIFSVPLARLRAVTIGKSGQIRSGQVRPHWRTPQHLPRGLRSFMLRNLKGSLTPQRTCL